MVASQQSSDSVGRLEVQHVRQCRLLHMLRFAVSLFLSAVGGALKGGGLHTSWRESILDLKYFRM